MYNLSIPSSDSVEEFHVEGNGMKGAHLAPLSLLLLPPGDLFPGMMVSLAPPSPPH